MSSQQRSAIVGVGYTEFSKASGKSTLAMAVEATRSALADAGIDKQDVGGVVTYAMGDSAPAAGVVSYLGRDEPTWLVDWNGGGNLACGVVGLADAAIRSGVADVVVAYRSLNGRSGKRLGGSGQAPPFGGSQEVSTPMGLMTYPQRVAMWCRRHMETHGTTSEQLGQIAIKTRAHAVLNERAVMRKPLDLEGYLASPMIADPLRLNDICLETDGAVAVVLSSQQRAASCRQTPVFVLSSAYGAMTSPGTDFNDYLSWPDMTQNFTRQMRDPLFGQAGVTQDDIDVAEIYDCFTHTVVMGLEGLGFCGPGEAGDYVSEPDTLVLGGRMPVNTHGGLLSEGYLHGMNHIVEAVEQLRGQSGVRQVPDAEVALVTGGAMTNGSGLILGRG